MEKTQKEKLIDSLKKKGFPSLIINAFEKVTREEFLPDNVAAYAYDDIALPIEDGSTISQPSTIAFMLSLLDPKQNQKVLEIGSGSGYALALISEIIKNGKIYGLEINQRLAVKSKKTLSSNSLVEILNRSGVNGLSDFSPFDRILVSASCQDMRIPSLLLDQLSDNGIMVAAVKQSIIQFKKESGKIKKNEFPGFVFVPFIYKE